MPTPAQIEEQVNFERDAIKCGLDKLRKNTKDLEDKQYASATTYGAASMDMLLPLVVERIESTNNKIHEGAHWCIIQAHSYLSQGRRATGCCRYRPESNV